MGGRGDEQVLRATTGKDQTRPVHGYSLVLSSKSGLINHFDKVIKARMCYDL